MNTNITISIIAFCIGLAILSSCAKPPVNIDYETLRAEVIGKENCKGSDTADFWLIDLSVYQYNDSQYGDTVTFNGRFYTKAVKLKGLDKSLQVSGTKVAIAFKVISNDKISSTGCTVSNPTTYPLREVTIYNQSPASF